MFIYLYLFHQSVGKVEGEISTVKYRFRFVDDAVVRWRKDDDIRGIVVHTLRERGDVVCFHNKSIILFTNPLACHLATIVVEQLQGVTY